DPSTMLAMRNHTLSSDHGTATWRRVIEFQGQLAPSAACALLQFGFSEHDHVLMSELSAKARAGSLTADEQTDLDTFERLGCLLHRCTVQTHLDAESFGPMAPACRCSFSTSSQNSRHSWYSASEIWPRSLAPLGPDSSTLFCEARRSPS